MDNLIFAIKGQIYETFILCKNFLKGINLSTLLTVIALLYIIFMRKWNFKKTFSFFYTMLLLFILLVRIEALLTAAFGAEDSGLLIGVDRTVFLIITAIVVIYHAAIKE